MLAFQSQGPGQQPPGRDQDQLDNRDKRKTSSHQRKNAFQSSRTENFGNDGSTKSRPLSQNLRESRTTLSNEELATDPIVGQFQFQSGSFQRIQRPVRELPRFLVYQSPALESGPIVQDEWDKLNQAKMAMMENKTDDLSSLWEEFHTMREAEREYMEKKGLVDKEGSRKTLDDAILFKGSCLDMCPVYERIRRSVENDVRKYEKSPCGKISKDLAVKAFSRPAAGQPPPLPSDVRPPRILVSTLDHLIDNILHELPDAQSFIWDRTRSIRQDFTYQNFLGPEAVECHEKIVRIHILTLHVMAKTAFEFSRQQELEQMNKALKTLSEMYAEYRSRNIIAPNEAEFRAYYLLSQLRDPELDREIQTLPANIIQDDRVQLALNIRNLIQTNIVDRGFQPTENVLNLFKNFFHNFKLGTIPLLMSYMVETHLNEIRFYAFKSIKRSLHTKAKPYDAGFYVDLLAFNDGADLEEFCKYYGIQIALVNGYEHVDITSFTHNSHLIPDQRPFRQAFSVRHDSKVGLYKELINTGISNLTSISTPHQTSSISPVGRTLGGPHTKHSTSAFEFQAPTQSSFGSTATTTHSTGFSFGANAEPPKSSSSSFAFNIPTNGNSPLPKLQEISDEEELRRQERVAHDLKEKQAVDDARALAAEQEAQKQATEQRKMAELNRQFALRQQQKKQMRIKSINALGTLLSDEILNSVVKDQVEGLLLPLVDLKLKKNKSQELMLTSFSRGLYEAFISELVYFETLEVVADSFRVMKLKSLLVKKIINICKESKKRGEAKKRKRQELADASRNFGIPHAIKKKRRQEPVAVERVKPIDLSPLNFDRLLENLSTQPYDKYEMLVFAEEFESTTSRFLRRKFAIGDNLTHKFHKGQVSLEVIGTKEINPKIFEDVSILVFNCDGIEKIREQKLMLRELVQGICLNTNYKFEIIVIYWEFEGIIKFSKEDILQELSIPSSDCIGSMQIIKLDPSLNCDHVQTALDSLGSHVGLSAKGQYNQKYSRPGPSIHVATRKESNLKHNEGPKQMFLPHRDESKEKIIPRHLKQHIESSPQAKQIPRLLSNGVKKSTVHKVQPQLPSNQFDLFKSGPKDKLKIDVYSTPRPRSSELLQTPSFANSSTISNLSNVTFANHSSSPLIINKPTYVTNNDKDDDQKNDKAEGVPRSILELRKLIAGVKQKHGMQK